MDSNVKDKSSTGQHQTSPNLQSNAGTVISSSTVHQTVGSGDLLPNPGALAWLRQSTLVSGPFFP